MIIYSVAFNIYGRDGYPSGDNLNQDLLKYNYI